jgi:anti-anti-sigma factor
MSDKSRAVPLAVLALRPARGAQTAAARWQDAEATVTVRGELDRDAVWAIDYTIARASAEAGRIVLDLREVTHVDYRGVPALVDRCKELRGRGGDLAVAVRNPYVANILKAAGGPELALCRAPEEAFGRAATVLPLRARRSP